jgi:two-component system chemotaxis response regulator CheB
MTGMGEDGAEGLGVIKAAGGFTIAQSEETCVVSGMPRAAITKGHVIRVIALEQIGNFLASQYGSERLGEKSEKDRSDKVEKNERTPVSSQRS